MAGDIILLNGPSSAGKSTLAQALQAALPAPFWHVSADYLFTSRVLPWQRIRAGEFAWQTLRPGFFAGYLACLPALAGAGNSLIVDHIIETQGMMTDLLQLLRTIDVFFVGVHCPLPELERRERARGDRSLGDARRDQQLVHTFGVYDLEIDSTTPLAHNVATIINAWQQRTHPSAFERMTAALP